MIRTLRGVPINARGESASAWPLTLLGIFVPDTCSFADIDLDQLGMPAPSGQYAAQANVIGLTDTG